MTIQNSKPPIPLKHGLRSSCYGIGLANRLRRAVVSTTSCTAEGFSRRSMKGKIQFYGLALGLLLTEVHNQLSLSKK